MTFVDMLGWLGAVFTLSVYSMKTMLPLRACAVASSLTFVLFGYFGEIWPTFVLHAILLPLNALRLLEILRTMRDIRKVRRGEPALDWVHRIERSHHVSAGTAIFSLGDMADTLYYVKSGRVRIVEFGRSLGPGDLFGEVAFFTEDRRRTASAICETDCELLKIDEDTFARLFYQNPAFGMYMTRVVASRLVDLSHDIRRGPVAG